MTVLRWGRLNTTKASMLKDSPDICIYLYTFEKKSMPRDVIKNNRGLWQTLQEGKCCGKQQNGRLARNFQRSREMGR